MSSTGLDFPVSTRGLKSKLKDLDDPSRNELAGRFWAVFAHEFFTQVYLSYVARSGGGSDSTGMVWRPLAKATIKKKRSLIGKVRKARKRSGGVSPSHYELAYGKAFARLASVVGVETARYISEKGAVENGVVGGYTESGIRFSSTEIPIMIETGRLIRSYRPGRLVGSRYYKPVEQIFEVSSGKITVGSAVEYAEYAERDRPVIHERVGEFVRIAVEKAIKDLRDELRKASHSS